MELYSDENVWQFVDEERKNINLPRRFSFGGGANNAEFPDSHLSSARTSCASAASLPLWKMSPETPWTRSPLPSSPSPPLLYHCLASLHRSQGDIFSITLSNDFIFTGSSSSRIHAWKQPDCTQTVCLKASTGQVRSLLASGTLLFSTHSDHRIRLWDLSLMHHFRPKKLATIPRRPSLFSYHTSRKHHHKNTISCLAYNAADKILYTGSHDHTVKVWSVPERRCVESLSAHEGQVNAVVVNEDDGCVFTCSSDGTVKIWRSVSKETPHILTMTLKFQQSPVNALALSRCGDDCFLYSGSSDGLINFWEKERISGRYNHAGFLQGHHFSVLCLVAVGDLILSGSEDATIRIWKREEGNSFHSCVAVIDGHHGPVRCLAAAMESDETVKGLLVYSASLDQTMKVWRVKVYPWEKGEDGENACRISPVLSPSWVERKIQATDY
ncbi:protein JINGUBANG-like [Salvia hispanica]|uniref:protein JINGUBANG-like n=1 Tax=Salvia hispanica TaxID=49212 RepID=UPI0020099065|nr:protein JINGUBANG-like [Salvia hispanica]